MRIVVAPDKFKGTLTAVQAAGAMAEGARAAAPGASIVSVPLADGGEGSLGALLSNAGGEVRSFSTSDPVGNPVTAPVGLLAETVFLEAAAASGLGLLDRPQPLAATTAGTGELILHAARAAPGAPIVVGVGGTASTDGGTGAARAAGWRFLDGRGRELPPGGGALVSLASIDRDSAPASSPRAVVGACDVSNPLLGERGAARVFAPQKGASPDQVDLLDDGLARLAEVVQTQLGVDIAALVHGGAGGGLGAGLAAFFGAELTSGLGLIARSVDLRRHVGAADLVITGEGRLDGSSLEGKVVGGVAEIARSSSVECVVVAGEIEAGFDACHELGVATAIDLSSTCGSDRAHSDPVACIAETVARALTA